MPVEHRGKRTREGARSGVVRRERMKRGNGIKGGDERSKMKRYRYPPVSLPVSFFFFSHRLRSGKEEERKGAGPP